ncbi:MAG: efflux RND transporter periplasmic adaptor subunit, partial [Bacteroidota bacterium]|nr:efflux RND transporter periplasmic adaptor subunit [Bacteroidota bacterium]
MRKNLYLVILLLATVFSCTKKEKSESVKTENIIPITTIKSVEKEYSPILNYTGTAFANKEANLGTTLPGRVEKTFFAKGTKVKKGALLVQLSNELYSQALIERNTLAKDYNRVDRLRKKGSVSVQDYDHVKAKYEAAKEKTEMMRKSSEIRAPFDGTIVDYLVNEGENFLFSPSFKAGYSHTSGIVQLMQLNIIKIKININEKDIAKIKNGQDAKIVFDAYPKDIYKGNINSINPILSTLTR